MECKELARWPTTNLGGVEVVVRKDERDGTVCGTKNYNCLGASDGDFEVGQNLSGDAIEQE